jgi:hypothetical protein
MFQARSQSNPMREMLLTKGLKFDIHSCGGKGYISYFTPYINLF